LKLGKVLPRLERRALTPIDHATATTEEQFDIRQKLTALELIQSRSILRHALLTDGPLQNVAPAVVIESDRANELGNV